MEEQQQRREKLRDLVTAAGGPAAFARLHDGVDPTYISQLLNGHRSFGERAARKMEERLSLVRGWFDLPDEIDEGDDQYLQEAVTLLRQLDTRGKIEAIGALKAIAVSRKKSSGTGTTG